MNGYSFLFSIRRLGLVFLFGAFCYGALEILWRGYTHPAMLLLGGCCLVFVYLCEEKMNSRHGILTRSLLYAVVITAAELLCGLLLNVILGLGIWDYSELPVQLLGQICLPFSLLWFLLSAVCCLVCRAFRFIFGK